MKHAVLLSMVLLGAMPFNLKGQNPADTSNFQVGIYGGYYISDNAPAIYYNGADNNRLVNQMYNNQIRPQIEQALGNREFQLEDYAMDMRYQNTLSFELSAAVLFGKDLYIAARLQNVKLNASGIFTLRVPDPNNPTGAFNNLEQCNISGTETRSHIEIGFGKRFLIENNLYFFAEGGLDMNFIEVKNNQFTIAGSTFNLPVYNNPLNVQASQPITFGMGFYLSTGIGYDLPGGVGFWLKVNYMQTNTDINKVAEHNSSIFVPGLGFTKRF